MLGSISVPAPTAAADDAVCLPATAQEQHATLSRAHDRSFRAEADARAVDGADGPAMPFAPTDAAFGKLPQAVPAGEGEAPGVDNEATWVDPLVRSDIAAAMALSQPDGGN